MPNDQKLKTMVKISNSQTLRLRNFDARHGKLETGAVVKSRRETNAVSSMRVMIVHQNRHRKPRHPLSHQCHEVEVRREKEVSEAKVTMIPFFDNRADIIWKVPARERLVNIGICPSAN